MGKHIQFRMSTYLQDLNPILAGYADMQPGYINNSAAQTYTLLHYICSGKGSVRLNDQNYSLRTGQAFIVPPGERCMLVSSEDDPFVTRWVGFTGTLSHGFSESPPVFFVPEDQLTNLKSFTENSDTLVYLLAADLFLLYSTMQENRSKRKNYSQYVMDYIQSTYSQKISVEAIAAQLGLDRRYLSQHFKKHTNYTIQGYILNVRITEAKRHLLLGYSIKETAHLCGFNDTANFSKLFAREEGLSPRDWKNTITTIVSEMQKDK